MPDSSKTATRPSGKAAGTPPAWPGRRRRPEDHESKRDAVIRTAARAFYERGYHNTSLDDIAAALGVTKPTVYYYVSSKEQLLFECFKAGLEPIRAALRKAELAQGLGRDRLCEVIANYARAIASEYGWCMVRAEHQDLGPELSGRVKGLKSEIDQGIRRLLRQGIEDGSIEPCDPKLASFAIAGALNWIAHWYREGESLTADDVATAFTTFLEKGLLPRPAPTSHAVRARARPTRRAGGV